MNRRAQRGHPGRGQAIDNALIELRERLRRLPPPVILCNKSHSGSRLLMRALEGQGVFMGAEYNSSGDALPLLPVVETCVLRYYPDYDKLWISQGAGPAGLAAATAEAFERHLAGYDPLAGRQWGWKLCESLYALPYFAYLFPEARVIHIVRDGRDVAWSNHVAPEREYWRKVYFNTARIQRWRGLALTQAGYERASHLFNALHWVNSVEQGRAYGSMLNERYREVRYEALCADLAGTMKGLMDWLDLDLDPTALKELAGKIHGHSIGKHRRKPWRQARAVLRLVEPTLASLGYLAARPADRGLRGWLRSQFR